ncbi:MAG TPA: hypothetical protein V6D47_11120 [Oscillatoriaceae cyanobacterium]
MKKSKLDLVEFGGWPLCVRLTNGVIEIYATTEVGPRILRAGFVDGPNMFYVNPDEQGLVGGDEWRLFGGHRLWHAPEAMPRTYQPDNAAIEATLEKGSLLLRPMPERMTGIQKEMVVTLGPAETEVRITHRLTNRGPWPVTLAPWALSVMAPGGFAVMPQAPFKPHEESLAPARPMVLWHYTDMGDLRWRWGRRFVTLLQDARSETPQKAGAAVSDGWLAYCFEGEVFIKRFAYDPHAQYPDFGSNAEMYTDARFLEIESLGPLVTLAPGASTTHEEHWYLHRAEIAPTEDSIADRLLPLVQQTTQPSLQPSS